MLQDSFDNESMCGSCDRVEVSNIEGRLVRPSNGRTVLEIQDQVGDTKLVGAVYQAFMHGSSTNRVEPPSAPACPECGERNPVKHLG